MKKLVACLLLLAACGGRTVSPAATTGATTPRATTPSPSPPTPSEETTDPNTLNPISYALCEEEFTPFLESLQELDARLNIGLSYDDYSERVGDVSVQYDRLDFDLVDPACLIGVGVPLENAFNRYVEAYNTWQACIEDINCSTDSITSKLQEKWSRATGAIENAEEALDTLRPS